jgi:predicted alpha-1,2-mannosidase
MLHRKKLIWFGTTALMLSQLISWENISRQTTKPVFNWSYSAPVQKTAYHKFANPIIGTDAHGHTFPGATVPFGMVQLSPDTRLDGWDGCSGYHYSDSFIYGFSHTHLSGTGCSDYGDILTVPSAVRPLLNNGANGKPGYRFSFNHKNEYAEAGYYKVKADNGILCELTASPRTGVHRYSFPKNAEAWLLIDLVHRDAVTGSGFVVENDSTISGWRYSEAWAKDQRVWFSATFSAPFTAELYSYDTLTREKKLDSKSAKAILKFGKLSRPLEVKLAISPVSSANAAQNRITETAGMNFDQVRKKANGHWNSVLGKIEVKGGTKENHRKFYTALYHSCIAPNLYSDVNGDYRGPDGNVHTDTKREHYTVFSLWDTYRTLHPLFTILEPKRTSDFINTFIDFHAQSGRLPMWELSANETNCMIGYHGVSVIADAWAKGICDYDTLAALKAMTETGNGNYRVQPVYRENGFVPGDEAESVSQTLEYAYDDWCIAAMAKRAGNNNAATEFGKRCQFWKNLFDPKSKFFRARRNNMFTEPFAADEVNIHYTEANAWHYSLYVPQDIRTLTTMHGGNEALVSHLDKMFTSSPATSGREQADITGCIGQYAHGNEPSHHAAYLYAYAGQHWKTQQRVREICTTLYTDKPDGLCGNDDCGQLSAWLVMSMAGFYPVIPGTTQYVIGVPQFDEVIIHQENGRSFFISATGAAKSTYINACTLNGATYNKTWIEHSTITKGGKLTFKMNALPNKNWGNATESLPPSPESFSAPITLSPRVSAMKEVFGISLGLELYTPQADAEIFWKKKNDSGNWKKYTTPLNEGYGEYLVFASRSGFANSDTILMRYRQPPPWAGITIKQKYAQQYSASGERALIDGITGTRDFRTGDWQGFAKNEIEMVVDLGKEITVDKIEINFLHDQRSWIFLPRSVEFFVSADGTQFTSLGIENSNFDDHQTEPEIKTFGISANQKCHYVKIIAKGLNACPEWHLGNGNKAWLFSDEIKITQKN